MSRLPGGPARADALRNERAILDAAAETIAEDPGAGLEQIARRAGLSRATLYAHFQGRDALMDVLTERSVKEAAAAIRTARPQRGSAEEAMTRVLMAAWETIGRYRGLVVVNQRLDPAELRARTAPAIALVRPLIRRGQQCGEFDPELPAEWLLSVVIDLIHAVARQVTAGTIRPQAAERVLLRTAIGVLTSHRRVGPVTGAA